MDVEAMNAHYAMERYWTAKEIQESEESREAMRASARRLDGYRGRN